MFVVLRQRNFVLLWAGGIISQLGDWVLLVALPLFVYQRTGSALATGTLAIIETLPGVCFGSLAGVFVDRWDRRQTMIVTDLLRTLVLLPLLLLSGRDWLWTAYAVGLLQSTISQFFGPAQGALVPQVVGEEHLVAANSLNAFGSELTRLIGPLLSGVLFGLLGLQVVIIVDCLSYAFSAGMSLLVRLSPEATQGKRQQSSTNDVQRLPHEWWEGLTLLRAEQGVLILFLVSGTALLGDGMIRAVSIPFLSQVARGDAILFSWIVTAQGIGAVAGSLVLNRVSKALPPFMLLALSAIIVGFFGCIEVAFPVLPLVLLCTVLMGAPVLFFYVGSYSELQKSVSDQYRGRMLGAYSTISMLAYLVGIACASLLAVWFTVQFLLLIGQLFYIAAGGIAWFMLWSKKQRDPSRHG
jgi:predicted MFS family arabinose efflux permease